VLLNAAASVVVVSSIRFATRKSRANSPRIANIIDDALAAAARPWYCPTHT